RSRLSLSPAEGMTGSRSYLASLAPGGAEPRYTAPPAEPLGGMTWQYALAVTVFPARSTSSSTTSNVRPPFWAGVARLPAGAGPGPAAARARKNRAANTALQLTGRPSFQPGEDWQRLPAPRAAGQPQPLPAAWAPDTMAGGERGAPDDRGRLA